MTETTLGRIDAEARRAAPSVNPGRVLGRLLTYGVLTVAAFVSVFPFFWMVVGTGRGSSGPTWCPPRRTCRSLGS